MSRFFFSLSQNYFAVTPCEETIVSAQTSDPTASNNELKIIPLDCIAQPYCEEYRTQLWLFNGLACERQICFFLGNEYWDLTTSFSFSF